MSRRLVRHSAGVSRTKEEGLAEVDEHKERKKMNRRNRWESRLVPKENSFPFVIQFMRAYLLSIYVDNHMKTTVKKWGNSAAVRIPSAVMEAADMRVEDVVDVSVEEGRIIVKPVQSKNYDLDDLVKGITTQNLHKPADFGSSQGKEIW